MLGKTNRGKDYMDKIKNTEPNIRDYPKARYYSYTLLNYLKRIEDLKNGLYRGQEEFFENGLTPKIFRISKEETGVIFNNEKELDKEKKIINSFKVRAIPHLEFIPNENDELKWLAIAQHYGLRTRLLDWTQNALIALWFCVKDGEPKEIIKKVEKSKRGYGVVYFYQYNENNIFDKKDEVNDKDKKNPFEVEYTKIYRPSHISNRIIAQSSAFTLHKWDKKNKSSISLEKEQGGRITIIKIPYGSFELIKNQLDKHGINSATVFPDLRGICKYLNYLEFEIPETEKKVIGKLDDKMNKKRKI
ncbi:MAG: FRG domain-containing protein [Ignavibacteriae bacterium]|nr:FRG domain-containing protein [Ignavibacteriota bacterium]